MQAESANIEFLLEDQSAKVFNKCKILAIDKDNDLAIIQLPIEAKFDKSLTLSSDKPTDGVDVYTAGYPALSSLPSWQFGKGIISNNSLHVDEIMIGNTTVIQHTAQIDAGSSGGPLLIKNTNSEYEIIGMNTWKAKDRENVNIAIPGSVIKKFITKYLSEKNKNYTKEELQQRVNDLSSVSNDGYKKILPFISYNFISHISVKSFFEILKKSDEKVKDEIIKQFNTGFPIEGVRIAIAENISKKVKGKSITISTINNFSPTDIVEVQLSFDSKLEKTFWISNYGNWMLENFQALKLDAEWSKGLCDEYGYKNSVGVAYNTNSTWDFSYIRTVRTYFTYGVTVNTGDMTGLQLNIGGELPYRFQNKLFFIPFANLYAGPEFNAGSGGYSMDSKGDFCAGLKIGAELSYQIGEKSYFIVGLGFNTKQIVLQLDFESKRAGSDAFFIKTAIAF